MTGTEYQNLARRTCSIRDSRKDMLEHGVFGLCSEAGEVAGIIQKYFQGHGHPLIETKAREHMVKELGDCLWMIAEICSAIGVNMNKVMETNIEKLKARYPEGFEAEKSLHRAEGDI